MEKPEHQESLLLPCLSLSHELRHVLDWRWLGAAAPASAHPRAAGVYIIDHHGGLNRWSRMYANNGRQTETLFHTYSQFASAPNIPAKPSEEELRVETRLNEVLEQVLRVLVL